jgi:hypothetical protein
MAAGLKGGFKALKRVTEEGLARTRGTSTPCARNHDG